MNSYESAGMDGTYRQYSPSVSMWVRTLDTCDSRAGYLVFEEGLFYLYDSYNGWIIALCDMTDTPEDEWESIQFYPSNCSEWKTIENDSLVGELMEDNTFTIQMDTQCASIECTNTAAPEMLCMDENSVMHGMSLYVIDS